VNVVRLVAAPPAAWPKVRDVKHALLDERAAIELLLRERVENLLAVVLPKRTKKSVRAGAQLTIDHDV